MIWMILSLVVVSSTTDPLIQAGLLAQNASLAQTSSIPPPTTADSESSSISETFEPLTTESPVVGENSSKNGSSGVSAHRIAFASSYCVLLLITIVGNCLVIAAFFKDPTLQAITNYWIVSLAMTDIVLAAVVMPLQVQKELHEGSWVLGELMCDIFICLDVLCSTCSIYHLGLISLDRFFCVQFPIRYPAQRTTRKTLLMISLTWLWCTLISMPRLVGWKQNQEDPHVCVMSDKNYMIFSSLISFFLPLILILAMYYGIFRVTQARSMKLKRELAASVRVRNYMADKEKENKGKKKFRGGDRREEEASTSSSPPHPPPSSPAPLQPSPSPRHHHPSHRPGTSSDNSLPKGNHRFHIGDGQSGSELEEEDEDSSAEGGGEVTEFTTSDPAPSRGRRYSFLNDRFHIKFHHPFRPLIVRFSRISLGVQSPLPSSQPPASHSHKKHPFKRGVSMDSATQAKLQQRVRNRMRLKNLSSPTSRAPSSLITGIRMSQRSRDRRKTQSSQNRLTKKRQKQENRTAKVVMIVLGAFVVFWSPFFLVNTISPLCATCKIKELLWKTVTFWGYCNSAINPFIYTFFNRTFRRAVLSVIKCDRPRRFR